MSQPAFNFNHYRISNNNRKGGRNELHWPKKKKGIRDILGDNLNSASAPMSAPSPLVFLTVFKYRLSKRSAFVLRIAMI